MANGESSNEPNNLAELPQKENNSYQDLEATETVANRVLVLPTGSAVSSDQIESIVSVMRLLSHIDH